MVSLGDSDVCSSNFSLKAKGIYNSSLSIVRKSVGKIPVITLVASVGFVVSLFVAYLTLLPAFTGAPLNALYMASIFARVRNSFSNLWNFIRSPQIKRSANRPHV
jgi:uncharacterized membrane protein